MKTLDEWIGRLVIFNDRIVCRLVEIRDYGVLLTYNISPSYEGFPRFVPWHEIASLSLA